MSLKKENFKNGITSLLTKMEEETSPSDSRVNFASGLADLIETFVKSGEVKVTVAPKEITVDPGTHSNITEFILTGVVE